MREPFKVQVGPAQIAIHQGQTVLVTKPDGQVNWPTTRGLYFRDTRVIRGPNPALRHLGGVIFASFSSLSSSAR
jgi:hypothetical protein